MKLTYKNVASDIEEYKEMKETTRYSRPKTLNKVAAAAYKTAKEKGFWGDGDNVSNYMKEKLLLIHSEVSEACESLRTGEDLYWKGPDGKPQGMHSELADVLIRTLDLMYALGADVSKVVEEKMAYNATRPYRHGNKRF
jgi:NTP pyrophosphatase (non-canonical NTP hydrolase)